MQKISVDPDLWARTRRKAFDTQTTASKIVAAALAEYLDRVDKPRADMATKQEAVKPPRVSPLRTGGPLPWDPPAVQDALPPPADITVEDLARVDQNTRSYGIGGLIVDAQAEPDGTRTIKEVKLLEVSVNAEPGLNGPITIINDPKEVAAKVEAALTQRADREFHPVPKPVRKPRPKR